MSIIDQLLGSNGSQESGSINESDNSASVDTSPALGLETGEILGFSNEDHSSDGESGDEDWSATDLSVVDGLSLGIIAPIDTDFHNSSSSADYSDSDSNGGGLLGGLL